MNQPQKVNFGVFLPQAGLSFDQLVERALLIERLGYHSLWLSDHMWSPRARDVDNLECLMALCGLAGRTERLRLGSLVLCNSFRNPALLAKMLTTLDHVSKGRLEVGIGAGWLAEEYIGYGYEFPSMGTRLKQLEEGLQILKAMFTEQRATFKGSFYSVADAANSPKPVQKPHPPITVGGGGEKVMLRLVAQYADRWNCPAGYRSFEQKLDALRAHCKAVGRSFESLEISEQVMICIARQVSEVEASWQAVQKLKPFSFTAIKGTPSQVVNLVRERCGRGVSLFTVLFSDFGQPASLELFANEVMPAFT
jgi:F420-dependent oxidoreductase-like protein